jgi:hypothetical protein
VAINSSPFNHDPRPNISRAKQQATYQVADN